MSKYAPATMNTYKKMMSLLLMSCAASAYSATFTWTGGAADGFGNWSNSDNWGGTPLVSATDSAINITPKKGPASNIDISNLVIQSLTFGASADAYVITGNAISINGSGLAVDSNVLIKNNAPVTQTINVGITMLNAGVFNATGSITFNGGINFNGTGGTRFLVSPDKHLLLNGALTGNSTGTVVFNGGGTVELNGDNTFTSSGAVRLWGSTTLKLGSSTALGAGTSPVEIGTNTSNLATYQVLTTGAVTIARDLRVMSNTNAGSTITIGGDSAHVSRYTGNIYVRGGSVEATPVTLTAVQDGRVNIDGKVLREASATGSSDTLTKTGAGIVSLNNENNYSGQTFVTAGTLLVNGNLTTGGGAVQVSSGATLGGNGQINRNVTILSSGIFAPGDIDDVTGLSKAEALTINGGLSFASDSIIRIDLGTASDQVTVDGALTLNGTLQVNAGPGFGSQSSYLLFSYTGTLFNEGLTIAALDGYTLQLDTSVANEVRLNVSSTIPEPGTYSLLAGCGGLLAAMAFRRGKQR